jgi:Organic solute transport protein 1
MRCPQRTCIHCCACAARTQAFRKLAHSSIMCLDDTSMDKLYDLITMGYKYQAGRESPSSVTLASVARAVRNAERVQLIAKQSKMLDWPPTAYL